MASMKCEVFEDNEYAALASKRLFKLLKDKAPTDTVIKSREGLEYRIHMSIVAGISEFFLEEFLSFGGNSSYEFEIDSSILNAIILFCYTGKIKLSDVNAGNLSTAANTLKIRSLMTACSDFLVADTMKEKPSPSKSGELSKSSPNQVNDLLKTSLTKYGSLDQTLSKLENLDEFAGLMRALDPSKSDYVTLIPELFANCDQNLVARAAFVAGYIDSMHHCTKQETKKKRSLKSKSTVLKAEKEFSDAPNALIACRKNRIVLKILCKKERKWKVTRAFVPLFYVDASQMVALNDNVYVFGNIHYDYVIDLSSYNRIDPTIKRLPQSTSRFWKSAVGSLDGKVYVIGGIDQHSGPSNMVQRFDPDLQRWSVITPLPKKNVGGYAVQFQDELYVIGGSEDQFFSYNIDEDAWKSRANPEFGCADLSVTTIGSHLYAAGRQVESNCINVQRYDHYTDKWTTIASDLAGIFRPKLAELNERLCVVETIENRVSGKILVYDERRDTWNESNDIPPVTNPCYFVMLTSPSLSLLTASTVFKMGSYFMLFGILLLMFIHFFCQFIFIEK